MAHWRAFQSNILLFICSENFVCLSIWEIVLLSVKHNLKHRLLLWSFLCLLSMAFNFVSQDIVNLIVGSSTRWVLYARMDVSMLEQGSCQKWKWNWLAKLVLAKWLARWAGNSLFNGHGFNFCSGGLFGLGRGSVVCLCKLSRSRHSSSWVPGEGRGR